MNSQDNNDRPVADEPEEQVTPNSSEEHAREGEHPGGWSPQFSGKKLVIGIFIIIVGILTALYSWGLLPLDGAQTTNNAYVRAQTTVISPQVAGYLTEVLVKDFDRVEQGQLLAEIDAAPYRQRVQQAQASVAAQRANLANNEQNLRSGEAQVRLHDASIASARAGLQKAQSDMRRIEELVDEGSVSLRERDQAQAVLQQADAGVAQAQAQRAIAAEQVRSVQVGRAALEAQVEGANASVELAQIELSRTQIRAPRAGRLSEIAGRIGQLVSAGTQLMYLVPDELWVTANFKETQTANIAVGQRATLTVDALGGAELSGTVQSIAPAAGSEFSLVKPDTGAGNFVKVPQRIAVRIVLTPGQELVQRMGPGMSVVATIHTQERE
jgi:multidrug resistance efflux pump